MPWQYRDTFDKTPFSINNTQYHFVQTGSHLQENSIFSTNMGMAPFIKEGKGDNIQTRDGVKREDKPVVNNQMDDFTKKNKTKQ